MPSANTLIYFAIIPTSLRWAGCEGVGRKNKGQGGGRREEKGGWRRSEEGGEGRRGEEVATEPIFFGCAEGFLFFEYPRRKSERLKTLLFKLFIFLTDSRPENSGGSANLFF